MRLKLKFPVLIIILSVLFYSCEKEYSLEGNVVGGTAVFSFTGSPTACVNPVITGTYVVGTALGATDIATISVDVNAAGTYTITTATVNGISFTGSGSFTTTGTQVVQLTGSGIPLAGGTFDFTPGSNGCIFSIIVAGSIPGSAIFIYNGAPGACTSATPAGTYIAGSALTASNTVSVSVNVTTIGTWSISTPLVDGFSFAGTGNFTTTGSQTVTLAGSGTPAAEGPFNFTPSNNGCSFSVTVNVGTNLTDFINCTIDGTPTTFNFNLAGDTTDQTKFAFGGDETSDPATPSFEIDLTKSPAISAGIYNQLSLTNFTTFCIGFYSDGVTASAWTIGTSGQTGTFSVNVTSYTTNRIQGTFSGTLYSNNGAGSGTKTITAGQFSVPY